MRFVPALVLLLASVAPLAASAEALRIPGTADAGTASEGVRREDGRAVDAPSAPSRGVRVVILDVSISEGLEGPLRERLETTLLDALRRQGLNVITPSDVSVALRPMGRSLSESCRAGRCVGWILEVLDGDAGMTVTIDAVENSYSVTLALLDPFGEEVGRAERRCDICTFDELADSIAVAGAQMASEIPRTLRPGWVGLFTNPPGARLIVDGVDVGVGPLSFPLPQGEHRVEAVLDGFRRLRRTFTVAPSSSERIELELVAGRDPPPRATGLRGRLRPWLWASFAAGLAAAAVGSALVGLGATTQEDEGAYLPLGAGLLGLGVGDLIAALVTFVIVRTQPDSGAADAPAAR